MILKLITLTLAIIIVLSNTLIRALLFPFIFGTLFVLTILVKSYAWILNVLLKVHKVLYSLMITIYGHDMKPVKISMFIIEKKDKVVVA